MIIRMLKVAKSGTYGKTEAAYKVFASYHKMNSTFELMLNTRLSELELENDHLGGKDLTRTDGALDHTDREADPKLQRRLFAAFQDTYRDLGIGVSVLDLVELVAEEHNRIRRYAAAGEALDAVIGYAVDQLRQRLLQANDEAASRKRPA